MGAAVIRNAGYPHLTPTLSAPEGGEGEARKRAAGGEGKRRGSGRSCHWPKMSSGRKALTTKFGTSTNSLSFKSTATLQIA